jgi:hypothetical protein
VHSTAFPLECGDHRSEIDPASKFAGKPRGHRLVKIRPPIRSRASSTANSTPDSRSTRAAASPAAPAPNDDYVKR